jgi:hypothetical protein
MLKNVSVSKSILEDDYGFVQVDSDRYHTMMKKGNIEVEVMPNGSIHVINGKEGNTLYDYKAVKRHKLPFTK